MSEPKPLNPTEQDALVKQIGLTLMRAAPEDWQHVTAEYRATGRYFELSAEVRSMDGDVRAWSPPQEVAGLFARLRAGMYRDGRGTWSNARYQLDHPSSYNLDFDRAEPSWQTPPPPQAYVDEVRFFPRTDENLPDWLRRRLQTAAAPPPTPPPPTPPPAVLPPPPAPAPAVRGYRTARVFDGAGPGGRPAVHRPPVPEADRELLLSYLDRAPVVVAGRGFDADVLDPDLPQVVPVAFQTDGHWIWPAAVGYYLRAYGVPPEPELVERARAHDFVLPEVTEEARVAAAANLGAAAAPRDTPLPRPPAPAIDEGATLAAPLPVLLADDEPEEVPVAEPEQPVAAGEAATPGSTALNYQGGPPYRVTFDEDGPVIDDRYRRDSYGDGLDLFAPRSYERDVQDTQTWNPFSDEEAEEERSGEQPRAVEPAQPEPQPQGGLELEGRRFGTDAQPERFEDERFEDDRYQEERFEPEPQRFETERFDTGRFEDGRFEDGEQRYGDEEYEDQPQRSAQATQVFEPERPAAQATQVFEPERPAAQATQVFEPERPTAQDTQVFNPAEHFDDDEHFDDEHFEGDDHAEAEARFDPDPEPEPEQRPEPRSETRPEPRPEPHPEPHPEPVAEAPADDDPAAIEETTEFEVDQDELYAPEPAAPAPPPEPRKVTPEEERELVGVRRALDELDVPPAAYRFGEPADRTWVLRTEGRDWEVAWFDHGPTNPVRFDRLEDAAAYLVGKLVLTGRRVPRPLPPPPPPRPQPRPPMAATGFREDQRRPLPPPRPAPEPAAETNGAKAQRSWPISPMNGEPPLTLFRHKKMVELPAGVEVDRFGDGTGNLVYAAGTPFAERSLVPSWINRPYRVYRLRRPVEALTGVAVPWFEQPGGGTAYLLPKAIDEMVADGVLVEVANQEAPTR